MLDELPKDQQEILLARLGEALIEEIESEAKNVSSFYNLCIMEMGSARGGEKTARVPNKTSAWIEVMHHKLEDEMPEFSHRYIERAIESFGGWEQAKAAFKQSETLEKAKYKFQFAYEDVLNA